MGLCFAWVLVGGCKQPPAPSLDYREARGAYELIVTRQADDAFATPEMSAIELKLARISPTSPDAKAAKDLLVRIAGERKRIAEEAGQHRRVMGRTTGAAPPPEVVAPPGDTVTPPVFDPDDYFPVPTAAKGMGFIDPTGTMVIEPRFSDGREFSEGLAAVRERDSRGWSYIDRKGRIVIAGPFEEARPFSEGYAAVADKPDNYFFIDRKGTRVSAESFQRLSDVKDGLALAKRVLAPKLPEPEYRWVTPRGESAFAFRVVSGCDGLIGADGLNDHQRRAGEPVLLVSCESIPQGPYDRTNRTWGYLAPDRRSWVLAPQKAALGHFTEGRGSTRAGLLNRNGRVVASSEVPPPGFIAGVAVAVATSPVAVDRDGQTLWKFPEGARLVARIRTSFAFSEKHRLGLSVWDAKGAELAFITHARPVHEMFGSSSVPAFRALLPIIIFSGDGNPETTSLGWLNADGKIVYKVSPQ
jgi:WG containing repeat